MGTFVIAGGSSGIGLQTARDLLAAGHNVILLARDRRKGDQAIASFGAAGARAKFLAVDLSTHDGVRDAARRVNDATDRIDGLAHSAAVFETKDVRTCDGIPVFFALSYFSRYHLTQLLLPSLLRADHPRVMMLVAGMNKVPRLDPAAFRDFTRYNFWNSVFQVNGACLYYAHHLTQTYPKLFAGCATPGLVQTGLFANAPWFLRAYVALMAPFRANSVETAAHNVVRGLLDGKGPSARNWNKPGDFAQSFPIEVDLAVEAALLEVSRAVTGA